MEKANGMDTTFVMVSPDVARFYLSKSVGNFRFASGKTVDNTVVNRYAADMMSGNWTLSPQGIIFDEYDRLIDGHHRLRAIIKSGVTILMAVTTGAPAESVKVLDTGLKRNPHLILAHTDGINKVAASKRGWSTAKMHFYYLADRIKAKAKMVPDSDIKKFVCEYADKIEIAVHCAEHESNKVRLTSNAACYYAALSALSCGVKASVIDEFFTIVATGIYENNGQTAAVVFKNVLCKPNQSRDTAYWGDICDAAQMYIYDFANGACRKKAYVDTRPVFTDAWFASCGLEFPDYFGG